MDSVYEPSPNGDSKTALSQKLGRKLNRVHKTPNWPSWHPGAPMAAHHGRIVAGSRPYRGRGPGRVAGLAAMSQFPHRTPRELPPVPQRPAPQRQRLLAPRAYCAPSAVSWPPSRPCRKPQLVVSQREAVVSWVCARHACAPARLAARIAAPCPGLAVLYCNTAQPFALVSCHNTLNCIAIQFSPYLYNTNHCIATQSPILLAF